MGKNGGDNIYRWLDLHRNVTDEDGWFLKGIDEKRRDCYAKYESKEQPNLKKKESIGNMVGLSGLERLARFNAVTQSRAHRAEHGTPIGNMERMAREKIEANQNQ